MNFAKRLLMVAGAVALAGIFGALLAPKTTHAIVATAVYMVNTAATPGLVSNIDNPGRIPYQSIANMTGKCPLGGNTCFWEFGNPPAGHRIVIQHVSGLIGFGTAPSEVEVLLNNGSGFPLSAFFAPFKTFSAFDQPVQAYFDPAEIIEVQIGLVGGAFPDPADSISEVVTLTGYELDCNAAPCPTIAK